MIKTPLKAIRAKCLECSNNSYQEVRQCCVRNCPLYPYRYGKRPSASNDTTRSTSEASTPENMGS